MLFWGVDGCAGVVVLALEGSSVVFSDAAAGGASACVDASVEAAAVVGWALTSMGGSHGGCGGRIGVFLGGVDCC